MDLAEYKRAYYLKNKEKILKRQELLRSTKKSEIQEYNRLYRSKNEEKLKAIQAEWRSKNKDWKRAWDKANLHRHRGYMASRKSAKLLASPKWANQFFIDEAYRLASLRSEILGYPWEVDHIVPLKSKIVCGLHTHTNLQVIPGSKNLSKGNRWWPEMPTN